MIVRKKVRNRKLKGKARRGTTIVTEVEVSPKSPYMGSRLTVFNRKEFAESKKEQFIRMRTENYQALKDEIFSKEGTEEEKQKELEILDSKQLTREELEDRAAKFARFEVNKEQKHYKAYLKGDTFFKYQGMIHPVMTEEFMLKAKGLKEIHKSEESNDNSTIDGREIAPGANTDPVHSGDEGRVSETV